MAKSLEKTKKSTDEYEKAKTSLDAEYKSLKDENKQLKSDLEKVSCFEETKAVLERFCKLKTLLQTCRMSPRFELIEHDQQLVESI